MPDVLSRLGSVLVPAARRLGRGWRRTARAVSLIPEALEAVVLLPRQLEVIAFQTATLKEMHEEIAAMRASVERLADITVPLEGAAARLGRLSDRWPAPSPRALRSS